MPSIQTKENIKNLPIIDLPKSIPISKRSPHPLELTWLHNKLKQMKGIKNILEFSGGITTWTVYDALKPLNYVSVEAEAFSSIFNPVKEIYPNIKIVHNWLDIPRMKYDMIIIDGSSCAPLSISKNFSKNNNVYRKEALIYSEDLHQKEAMIIFHDWCNPYPKLGWRAIRNYCENSEKYEFIEALEFGNKGFGIFKKLQ